MVWLADQSNPAERTNHKVDRVLGFFSSRPNWDPLYPTHRQASVPLSFGSGGTHSIAGEGVGAPIRKRGQTLLYLGFVGPTRREIITVRGQSYVSRLPKYW